MRDRDGSSWIATFTGRKFRPPDPAVVYIRDIAHALSCTNRFTGHVGIGPYSVAQHSVLVSQQVSPPLAIAALCHDAAEAYMGDIARPWKRRLYAHSFTPLPILSAADLVDGECEWKSIKKAEKDLLRVIFAALNVPWPDETGWHEIDAADELLLVTEARDFFGHQVTYFDWQHHPRNGYTPLAARIVPVDWKTARRQFFDRWADLTGEAVAIDDEPIQTVWGDVS